MSPSIPHSTTYRAAAIQYEPDLGEKERNIGDLLRLVEEAARHDARLIVLPEMVTTGYCWLSREEIAPHVEPIPGPTTDRFQQLAATYGCYIAISLPEVDPATDVYYNSMALIGPDGVVGKYRKIHSYISEPRWARDGDLGIPVWETPLGRLSGIICMDAEYFEAARIAALHKADVLLFPTNWDDEHCPSAWWMARAFENGTYLIAADRSGRERGVQFGGGSCIIDPDGSIQAYIDKGDGIVYGEIDLARARDKRWGPPGDHAWGDRLTDRRPAEYVTLTNNTYLWEPLRFHGLYAMGELPAGQLSCVGFVQMNLEEMAQHASHKPADTLRAMIDTLLRDNAPASPDVLVLPELALPGPPPTSASLEEAAAHFRQGAITLDGPETKALIELAAEFQVSLVLGVAEREPGLAPAYYNTILLIDPEGVYGVYRKLHLTALDRLWASPGNKGLPTFDTPAGRIGLAAGYDVLFPETLRVLACKGADLVCAPALLDFPDPIGMEPTHITFDHPIAPDEYDPIHYLIWRVRAAEHNVYLTLANWNGRAGALHANGTSGIFSPTYTTYPWPEVVAEEDDMMLTMMTIDTREQRTGRRSSQPLRYNPGDVAGSLTGELSYDIRDGIPGNAVRSKPLLRKRQPYWYLDLARQNL